MVKYKNKGASVRRVVKGVTKMKKKSKGPRKKATKKIEQSPNMGPGDLVTVPIVPDMTNLGWVHNQLNPTLHTPIGANRHEALVAAFQQSHQNPAGWRFVTHPYDRYKEGIGAIQPLLNLNQKFIQMIDLPTVNGYKDVNSQSMDYVKTAF